MIRVSFLHLRDTWNVGDRWCSPFDYFDWRDAASIRAQVSDLRLDGGDYDVGVFGGGKIMRNIASSPAYRQGEGRLNIGWGLSTVQRNPFSPAYRRARLRLDLIGSRDWEHDGKVHWVPCPSSQDPFFDAPPSPDHEVVVYAHFQKSRRMMEELPGSIPWRYNHGGDLDDALRFIASGGTVVSNSYHGVFWALLMGRRVLCLPFSNKFTKFRLPPGFSSDRGWMRDLSKAKAQPDLLDLCRQATARFRPNVDSCIEAAMARRRTRQ